MNLQVWHPMSSGFSACMALVAFSGCTLICCLLSRKAGWSTLRAMGFSVFLTVARCLLPFELPGIYIIRIGSLFTRLYACWSAPFWESLSLRLLAGIIWAVGSCICLVRLCVVLIRQRETVVCSAISTESGLYRKYLRVLKELSCPKAGIVGVSPEFQTAMMAGFFRPDVLLPGSFLELSDEELHLVLRHEIMHYRSRDLWIKLFMELLRCLLWWNPAAHYLCASVGQLLEMRCDSRVCADLSERERIAYSQTILNTFRRSSRLPAYLAAGYAGYSGKERMKQRFRQIIGTPENPKRQRKLSFLIIAISVCIFIGSYAVIFQTGDRSVERKGPADSFILSLPNDEYQVFYNYQLYSTISEKQLKEEPFCSMPIYEANISENYQTREDERP